MSGRSKRSEKQKKHLEEVSAAYRDEWQKAKELLNKSPSGAKPRYNNPHLIAYKLAYYIETCRQQEKPLTEAGLQVALSLDRTQYKAYLNAERDYIYRAGMEAQQSEKDIQLLIDKYKQIDNIQDTYKYLIDAELNENEEIALELHTPLQKARQLISMDREERLSTSGKVADIYIQKAREGEDWQEQAQRTEHVIQIGNNNALQALAELGYTKE